MTAAAAPDGTFRLAGLPAGSYALEYRDCAPPEAGYLTTWSGGAAAQSTAARVQVAAGQVRHVPVMMLRPVNTAAAIAAGAGVVPARARRQRPQTSAAAAAAKTGEITGKVTGKGKPLSGICVDGGAGAQRSGLRRDDGEERQLHGARMREPGRYHVIFALPFCPGRTNWLTQVYKDDNSPFALFQRRDSSQGPRRSQDRRNQREPAPGRRDLRHRHQQVRRQAARHLRLGRRAPSATDESFGFESSDGREWQLPPARAVPRQVLAAVQHRLRLTRQQLRPCHTLRPSRWASART